jgi:hypothetical protein
MKRSVVEKKVDLIESTICKKIESSSGFGDIEHQIKTLIRVFRFYDVDNCGFVNFKDFFAAMTKNNFVGVQREVENLFNRYDEDNTGLIDYIDFSRCLFGSGSRKKISEAQQAVFMKISDQMIRKSGITGVQGLSKYLRKLQRINDNGLKIIDGRVLSDTARKFISISTRELDLLFNSNQPVNLDEFLAQLTRGEDGFLSL